MSAFGDQTATRTDGSLGGRRLLHTMLRVGDLDRSIAFYTGPLGMRLFRREDYPDGRFTLAFVGYGEETTGAVIELTHNWDASEYQHGTGFGHIALGVRDAKAACEALARQGVKIIRPAGPMTHGSPDRSDKEVIAFIGDPDGYRIELIEMAEHLAAALSQESLYERLGGYDALAAFARDFSSRLFADPKLERFWSHRGRDGIERELHLIVDYLAAKCGGPFPYTGRDLRLAHVGMKVDEQDWGLLMKHLNATLNSFKLSEKERAEVLAFIESTKADIVESPGAASR